MGSDVRVRCMIHEYELGKPFPNVVVQVAPDKERFIQAPSCEITIIGRSYQSRVLACELVARLVKQGRRTSIVQVRHGETFRRLRVANETVA